MNITTVTVKGQATIPRLIRTLLDIKTGDKIFFKQANIQKKEVVIRVVTSNPVDELYGSLTSKVPYMDMETARKKAAKFLEKNIR